MWERGGRGSDADGADRASAAWGPRSDRFRVWGGKGLVQPETIIAELNRGYVCPSDAGPAWRAACGYGFDMSQVEDALRWTPEERLEAHQRALDLVLEIATARERARNGDGDGDGAE